MNKRQEEWNARRAIKTVDDGRYCVLLCPNCGGNYTHHGEAVVMERKWEDGDGIAVRVDGQRSETFSVGADAFPGRRGSIRIEFDCEDCEERPILHIMQHKGQTLMFWGI